MFRWNQQEKELGEKLRYVELLGELNISEEWVSQFRAFVTHKYRNYEHTHVLRLLTQTYPICLAVYLVMQGVYGYWGGDYWSQVLEDNELSVSNTLFLGQFFEKFLNQHSLPSFHNIKSFRYVSNILVHGGIPNYSLRDFFEYVLEPAIVHSHIYDADAQDVIANWLASNHQTSIDKPIMHFLRYGRKFAIDFVTRCVRMARTYIEQESIRSAEELGLPERVTALYHQWIKERKRSRNTTRLRLQRPAIQLDPWGGTVFLDLPAQTFTAEQPLEQCIWRIATVSGETELISVNTHWDYEHWVTEGWSAELSNVSQTYSISFEVPGNRPRTWHFHSLSREIPIFAFDTDSGVLLPACTSLPARTVWLFFPQNIPVRVDGGRLRETFPTSIDVWSDYQIAEWDLSDAEAVIFGELSLPVEPDWTKLQPSLEGNEINGLSYHKGEPRIFIGSLPELCIPLPQQRNLHTEVYRWKITLREQNKSTAQVVSLTECAYTLQELTIRCSLDDSDALTFNFARIYELAVRGPLGRDASFTFAILPVLDIHIHPNDIVRLPTERGYYAPPHLMISTSADLNIESTQSSTHVSQIQPSSYRIEADPQEASIELMLRSRHAPGHNKVPLTIPFPMLRWAFVAEERQHIPAIDWMAKAITLPFARLEQVSHPRILVSLFPQDIALKRLRGQLIVNYDQQATPQILVARGNISTRISFNLAEATDSIRASNEGYTHVELELEDMPGRKEPVRLPLLHISRALGFQHLTLESCLVESTWLLSLSWLGGYALRHRVLRLWSLWRPWVQASTYTIPDSLSDGEYLLEIPQSQLPPGKYRAEITIENSWSSTIAQRPLQGTPDTIDVYIGTQEEQQDHLDHLPRTLDGVLELLLSSASQPSVQLLTVVDKFLWAHQQQCFLKVCETLLVLIEQTHFINYSQHALFTLCQTYLQQYPIHLLAFVYRYSRECGAQRRWQFEELLSRLVPQSGIEALLQQMYRSGNILLSVLLDTFPDLQNDDEKQGEAIAVLQDENISVIDQENREWSANTLEEFHHVYEDLLDQNIVDDLRQYLQDISQYDLLSAEQEKYLAHQIRDGQEAEKVISEQGEISHYLRQRMDRGKLARENLINHNLRLVVSIAKKYMSRERELQDLIQDGNLGLIKACEKFDPDHGHRFSTYATWWIRQSITRKLAEEGQIVRLPVRVVERLTQLRHAIIQLQTQRGEEPDVASLADHMNMKLQEVHKLLELHERHYVSLDAPISGDEDATLSNTIVSETSDPQSLFEVYAKKEMIREMINALNKRQRFVLVKRYGLEGNTACTLEEVGKELQLTRERIRQLEQKALKTLRNNYGSFLIQNAF